jgi:5-methylcytosine-specific restriction endonuclease McrA
MEPRFKTRRLKLSPSQYSRARTQVFENQGWHCAGCGRVRPLTLDHRKKRSQQGGDEIKNLQGLCMECHNEKDNVAKSKSKYWKRMNTL